MRRLTFLLGVSAGLPLLVAVHDLMQDPRRVVPALLCLLAAGVLIMAASLAVIFPADSSDTIVSLVTMSVFEMVVRALIMQSVSAMAVTVVVAGFLFLIFWKIRPRVREH